MTQEAHRPKRPEDFINLDLVGTEGTWSKKKKPVIVSVLVHLTVFLLLAIPITGDRFFGDPINSGEILIRFYEKGATGPGGGGGGGGSGGRKPTTYIRARLEAPKPEVSSEPRVAPIAPRELPPLVFGDDLNVPDLPTETEMLFGTVFSPDAVPSPGLSFEAGADLGGLDTEPSSGTGGGIGGGEGTGVGEGKGWGVGPGEGGGFGGGQYQPGAWDIEPILVEEVEPDYPAQAIEHSVRGELIVQVLVKIDGSTTVLRVLKSLPHGCVDAAVAAANKWRWKPALKDGQPVEAAAIITFEFDLLSQRASTKRKKG